MLPFAKLEYRIYKLCVIRLCALHLLSTHLLHLVLLLLLSEEMSQAYNNPLHRSTPPSASQFSTLQGALGASYPSSGGGCFASKSRKRVPQPQFTPSIKWRKDVVNGRGSALQPPIAFDLRGGQRQGIYMRDLIQHLSQMPARMEGAMDPVLKHTGITRITFHILVSF